MSNDVAKTNEPRALDEFEGWTDAVQSENEEQFSERSIIGQRLKFSNEGQWLLPDDTELKKPVIAANVRRSVVKWMKDKGPPTTRFLQPGEPFPALTALNEATPKNEWVTGFNGEPRGPWELQHLVYLVDPISLDQYTFPTGTTGGAIAVRDLVNRIELMRRFRGAAVYPIVTLATKWMPTKFAGRLRPHFEITDWTRLGPDDQAIASAEPQPQLAPPVEQSSGPQSNKPAAPVAASTPKEKVQAALDSFGAKPVAPVTLAEETGDMIPF